MSISREGNGTYTVQVWYKDWQGARRKKTKRGFATKVAAGKWEAAYKSKSEGSPSMLFSDFCELYERTRKPQIKLNTWKTKEQIIQKKLLPYFGSKNLDEITPADVSAWQNALLQYRDDKGRGYSPTYLRTVANQLSTMFNHAVKLYNLPANPMLKVDRIGNKDGKEMLFWTKEEYLRFADEMMDKPLSYIAFEILYWTGIREGELLALIPSDFDFKKKKLSITKSYQRIDKEDVVTSPKTKKSNRVIVLPSFLVEEVEEYFEIFHVQAGERIFAVSKSYLYHEMSRGSSAAGVKRIRVHDLRHSHVSLLIDMGFSALAIADRLGHESIDITYRYAHLFPSRQTEMANNLDSERGEHEYKCL